MLSLKRLFFFIITLCVFICCKTSLFAGGTTAAQILEIYPSAKGESMGGAFCGVAGNLQTAFYNPASLANVSSTQMSFSNTLLYEGIRYQSFGFAYNLYDITASNVYDLGTISGYFVTLDSGNMIKRNEIGIEIGDFSSDNSLFAVAYGKDLISDKYYGNLMFGIMGKFFKEDIDSKESSGEAFDSGLLWYNPYSGFSFGASILNMGSASGFKEKYDLPLKYKAGGAYHSPNKKTLTALGFEQMPEGEFTFNFGFEYFFAEALAVRFGYNSFNDAASGLTAGFGVDLKSVDIKFFYANEILIDYAFIPGDEFDGLHKFSIVSKFGTKAK